MIFFSALSLLIGASPLPFTNVDPPLKIESGAGLELQTVIDPNGESMVRGSGWLVIERANVSFAVTSNASIAMKHVVIECRHQAAHCFIAEAIAGQKYERESLKRLSTTRVKILKIAQRSDKKIIAEERVDCARSRWTLDLKAQRVVVETRKDPNGHSEMDACPEDIKVDAHLGTFEEASRVFHARDPAVLDFKASDVPSATPLPIEIVEGENPRARSWRESKDEGIGASGWVIVDESDAGALAYEKSILKKVSIQCHKKECTIAEAKIFKAADNPARQLVGSELHFAKLVEWDAAHAVIEQLTACARLRWSVSFKDEHTTLTAVRGPGAAQNAACPQDLKLSAHLGTFKDAVAAFRDAK